MAQDARIEAQKRLIADLEKKIAGGERQIATLRSGRASAEQTLRSLALQIDSRNRLMDITEKEVSELAMEVHAADSTSRGLTASLDAQRGRYAEMVREAYRNYKHNNFLTYLFSSKDFRQVASRIANLREMAAMREQQIGRITRLSDQVAEHKLYLTERQRSLDSVKRSLTEQRVRLQNDSRAADSSIRRLSEQEKKALQEKVTRERQLEVAVDELRRLAKGNTEGASFTAKTTHLRLPVAGGTVKSYKGNMAEISGSKGAQVTTIYEGKVVEIKTNRITGKYEVYVAHGEYISTYANLNSVGVAKGAVVKRNQVIGVIGSGVDLMTMAPEYRMVFGIFSSDGATLSAKACFQP